MAKGLGQISQHQVEGLVNLSSQHDEMYNTLNDVSNSGIVTPNLVYNNGQLEVNVPIKALNQNIDANGDQSLITRKYLTQKLDEVSSTADTLKDSVRAAQKDIEVLYSNDSHVSVYPGQVYDTAINDTITVGTIYYKEFVSVQPETNGVDDIVEKPVFRTVSKELKLNLKPYAPVNSPTLTGTPQASVTIPTSNSTQRLATTKFVHSLISDSVVGSGATLKTFKAVQDKIASVASAASGATDKKIDFNSITLSAVDTVTTHTKIGSVSFGTGNASSVKSADFYVDLTSYAKHTNPTLTGAKTKTTIAATDNTLTVANTKFVHTVVDNLQTALVNGASLGTFKQVQDRVNSIESVASGGIDTKQDKHSLLTALSALNTIAKDRYVYTSANNVLSSASITQNARTLLSKSTVRDMLDFLTVPKQNADKTRWQCSVEGADYAVQAGSATTASKATEATKAGQDSLGAAIDKKYQTVSDLSTAVSKLAASVATYDSSKNKIVDTYQTKTADRIPSVTASIAAPSALPQNLYGTIKISNGKSSVLSTHTIVTGLHNATLTGTPKAPAYSETSTYYSKIATEQDIANMIAQAVGVTVTVESGGGTGTPTGSGGDTSSETVPGTASNGSTVSVIRDPNDPTKITIVSGNSSIPVTTTGGGNEIVNITLTGGSTVDVTVPGSANDPDLMTKVTLISAALDNDSLFSQHVKDSLDTKQDKTATLTGLLNNAVIKSSYNVTIPANNYYYATSNNKLGVSSISSVGRDILKQPTKDDVLRYLNLKQSSGSTTVTNQTIIGGSNTTLVVGGDISSVDYASVAGTAGFATKASLDSSGNVIASYYIPKTDIYVYGGATGTSVSSPSAANHLGWTANSKGNQKVLSLNDLAFWNGKYNATASNLQYFKIGNGTGSLGTMASLTASDYFEKYGSYNAAKYAVRDGKGNTIDSHYAVASDVVSNVVLGSNSTQLLVTRGGATTSLTPAHHSYKMVVGNTTSATAHTAVTKGNNKTIYLNLVDTFNGASSVISNPVQLNAPANGNVSLEATNTGIVRFYAPDTDKLVEQKPVTTNSNYYILGTGTASSVSQTASANFSTKVYLNASTGLLTATSVKAAAFIDNNNENILKSAVSTAFAVCTNDYNEPNKTVNVEGISELKDGLHLTIMFNLQNYEQQLSPTQLRQKVSLQVNNLGSYNIYYNGAQLTLQYLQPNCCYTFVFYNKKWYLCGTAIV